MAPTEPDVNVIDRRESTSLARLDPQALIHQAIVAGSGIDTIERLVALAKDVREVQAREAWYEAMAEFQRRAPAIKKTASAKIQTRGGGSYAYRFAPLDEITSTIQPVMGPLGLSISWRSRVESKQVVVSCRISHTLGHHEESGEIAMPITEGETGANPMQRVGIAMTYAKRYALLGIIGMAPEDDDDAASASGHQAQAEAGPPTAGGPARGGPGAATEEDPPISEPQSKRLWAIAREQLWSQEDIKDLLTSFGVGHTKDIPRSKYDAVIQKIKAEKKAPPTGTATQQGTLA